MITTEITTAPSEDEPPRSVSVAAPAAAPAEAKPPRLRILAKCADDRDVHTRTLKRHAKSDPDFPKLILIGGRFYVVESEWEEYLRVLISRSAQPRLKTFPLEHSATNKDRKVPALAESGDDEPDVDDDYEADLARRADAFS